MAQGVIVNNGAPLVNNTDGSRGYSFNNDNDSGLFSTQEGKVSIYTNGVERFRANTTGTATIGNDTIKELWVPITLIFLIMVASIIIHPKEIFKDGDWLM